MQELHDYYIKNKYNKKSKSSFKNTDNLMDETKTIDVYEDFSSNKKFLISVIIQLSQNTMIIQIN